MSSEFTSITYPIGVRGDIPKLGILVPGLIGDFFNRRFENHSFVNALNVMDSYKNRQTNLESFNQSNSHIKVGGEVWIDVDHKEELMQQFQELVSKGFVTEGVNSVRSCSIGCKRVEFLSDVELKSDKGHLVEHREHGDICKVCQEPIVTEDTPSLVVTFPNELQGFNVYPKEFQKDVDEIARRLSGMRMLVSRQRDTGIKFQLANRTYNLDIDFLWFNYLNTINADREKVVIIGSNHVRQHLMYITALSNMTAKSEGNYKRIKVVMPSYITPVTGFEMIPAGGYMDIEDSNIIRLLVYSSISWTKDAKWATEFYKYIQKKLGKIKWIDGSKIKLDSADQVLESCNLINRSNIQRSLNNIDTKSVSNENYDIRGMIVI